jgi:hypothetical protein
MLTVLLILVIAAFGCTIAAAVGKCPLWVGVVLLCVVELVRVLPIGR